MYGALAPAVAAAALLTHHGSVTVQPGDTLSGLSLRYCGTAADYPGLAAASGITDPDRIGVGQRVTISCSAAGPRSRWKPAAQAATAASYSGRHAAAGTGDGDGLPPGGAYCQPNCWGDGDGDGYDLDHSPFRQAPAYQGRHSASRRSYRTVAVSGGGGGAPAGASGFEACVIARESGGNAQVMNPSGHYGLYQFSASTWAAYGGAPGDFGHATPAQQRRVFLTAIAQGGQSNWSPYDGC